MKIICVIFASLLFAQAYARVPAIFEQEDLTVEECIAATQCMAEKIQEHEFELDAENSVVVEIVTSLIGVIQGYFNCQAILSDPPSRWEEMQHQACMAIWAAQSLIVAARVRGQMQETSENVRSTWEVVQENCTDGQPFLPCIGHLITDPDATEIAPY